MNSMFPLHVNSITLAFSVIEGIGSIFNDLFSGTANWTKHFINPFLLNIETYYSHTCLLGCEKPQATLFKLHLAN